MTDIFKPELALDEEKKEPRDWLATIRVTDRVRKLPEHDFVRSEEKAKIALDISRHQRLYDKEAPEISDAEFDALQDKLRELNEADVMFSWEDELEADQLSSEAEVEILALTHYHKTWNDMGRVRYRGQPRYNIEVLDIRERAIQRPRLLLPGG